MSLLDLWVTDGLEENCGELRALFPHLLKGPLSAGMLVVEHHCPWWTKRCFRTGDIWNLHHVALAAQEEITIPLEDLRCEVLQPSFGREFSCEVDPRVGLNAQLHAELFRPTRQAALGSRLGHDYSA